MKVKVVGPHIRGFTARVRGFSTQAGLVSGPVAFVKEGSTPRINSILGPSDKHFPLPGDVSHRSLYKMTAPAPAPGLASLENSAFSLEQIMSTTRTDADINHLKEIQKAALEDAQKQAGEWPVELSVQECPRLLKNDLKYLFPNMGLEKMAINVLNLTQKTSNDMSAWSKAMEEERDVLTASFISSGQAICSALRRCGFWADFVDPASGRPFLGQYSNHALFETDDVYKNMGFQVEDLGCCKVWSSPIRRSIDNFQVLKHVSWGSHAFVGTLFTNAPLDSQIVQDILTKVNEEAS